MADTPESKPAFWSSLPGILTGIGGIIVAVTGLITALYSTGVIGPQPNSNAVPALDSAVKFSSTSSPAPVVNPDNDRYKGLKGKWRLVEEPSQDPHFGDVKRVTWDYDASVKDNVLTLTGKILFVNGVNDPPIKGEELIIANIETQLTGLSGVGKYVFTKMPDLDPVTHDAKIQMNENLREFDIVVKDQKGKSYKIKGRKQ